MRKRTNKPESRAKKGEGSTWQSGGRTFYRYTHEGKRYTIADADPERAQAKFTELKAKLATRAKHPGGRQKLRDYAQYWIDDVLKHDIGPSTAINYAQRVGYHITPTLGDYALDELTAPMLVQWRNAVAREFAHSSATQALNLLKRMLDQAVIENHIPANPALSIRTPRAKHTAGKRVAKDSADRILSKAQIVKLLETAARPPKGQRAWMRIEALYTLTVRLGFRKGEILGLRIEDIDLEAGTVEVHQQVQALRGKVQISETVKTDAGQRSIPLSADLIQLIREHLVRTGRRSGLLFSTASGRPIAPRNLSRHFKGILKRAELPDIRFHDLRATAITHMRRAGIKPEVIARIVGHETIDVTMNTYVEADMSEARDAVERMAG